MFKLYRSGALLAVMLFMIGCTNLSTEGIVPPNPSGRYVNPTGSGWMTEGMDAKDYQRAAEELVGQLLRKRQQIPDNYVLALGPVDTSHSTSSIDFQRLQDKLELALSDSAHLRFSAITSSSMEGMNAFEVLNKLAQLNFENLSSDDKEWLQMFGKRTAIDGILYGRISSEKVVLPNRAVEVTYTCVWRVADVKDGLVKAIVEYEFKKIVRR